MAGIDFTMCKKISEHKVYICLFTCATTGDKGKYYIDRPRASTTLTNQEKDQPDHDNPDDDIIHLDHGADRPRRDSARHARVKTRQ